MSERIEITISAEEVLRILESLDLRIEETERKASEAVEEVGGVEEKASNMLDVVGAKTTEASGMIDTVEAKAIDAVDTVEEEASDMVKTVEDKSSEAVETVEEKASDMVDNVEAKAQESFEHVMNMMRASYLIISGVSRVMDQGMSQTFSSMYMVAVSTIGTYKAIAAAIAASGPAGWIQAAIMLISLATATSSLASVVTGQRELSTQLRGVNMALHGIQSLMGDMYFV